jgi:hypothetical protein
MSENQELFKITKSCRESEDVGLDNGEEPFHADETTDGVGISWG